MTITIPSGRTLPLQAKAGGGFASSAMDLGGDPLPPGVAPTIVFDGFESADMAAPNGPQPYLNNGTFQWENNNKTSVVTTNQDGNVVVYNNGVIYNANTDPDRDFTAKNGDYCLRFVYQPLESWTEQKWNTGSTGYPELWMSYWERIPLNMGQHGQPTKYFSIYMDGYEAAGDGSTVWMQYLLSGEMRITHSIGRNSGSSGYQDPYQWFDPINDRGRWFHIVVRVVAETSTDADDGIMQVWRKWEDESTYTQTHNVNNWRLRIPDTGPQGWAAGYLHGWVDGGYTEQTEWLLDDFKLSETSLLEV